MSLSPHTPEGGFNETTEQAMDYLTNVLIDNIAVSSLHFPTFTSRPSWRFIAEVPPSKQTSIPKTYKLNKNSCDRKSILEDHK